MKIACCLAPLLFLTACGAVYNVTDDPASGGVPFLPIISVDVTTMTFEQRWAEVELSLTYEPDLSDASSKKAQPAPDAKKGDKPAAAAPAASDKDAASSEAKPRFKTRQIRYLTDIALANTLLKVFNEESTPIAASEKLNLRFKNDPDKKLGLEEPAPLAVEDVLKLPVASIERRRDQVPGPKPLYLNVPVSAGGSGVASVELSASGTLSKSTARTKNEIATTLMKSVGTVVSSIIGLPGSSEGAFGVPVVDARMRVTIVRRVYVITLSRPTGDASTCNIASLVRVDPVLTPSADASTCNVSFTSVVLRGEDIDNPLVPKPMVAPTDDEAPKK